MPLESERASTLKEFWDLKLYNINYKRNAEDGKYQNVINPKAPQPTFLRVVGCEALGFIMV